MRKKLSLLAVGAALCLLASGCSGSSDNGKNTNSSTVSGDVTTVNTNTGTSKNADFTPDVFGKYNSERCGT
ncbi:MAG: hypothetical protein GX957_10175 [Clostridiaceae bacterium]|nr:hypothetical protein [Clostridiaceae bacterium]